MIRHAVACAGAHLSGPLARAEEQHSGTKEFLLVLLETRLFVVVMHLSRKPVPLHVLK
jgi:hypothetical protein